MAGAEYQQKRLNERFFCFQVSLLMCTFSAPSGQPRRTI
jgi:hypothetical protein